MSLICVQRPESSGNGKTTLEKRDRDPPDVTLDYILNDLFSYLNEFEPLRESKRDAEEKYNIRKEDDGCWPADDIKRAWGETKRMEKETSRRKHWTLMIMLQLIERQRKDPSRLIEGRNISQNSEDSDELESEGEMDYSGGNRTTSGQHWQIYGVRQSGTETQYLVRNQATGNIPGVPSGKTSIPVKLANENMRRDETLCIRTPLAEMGLNEPTPKATEAAGGASQHSGGNPTTSGQHGQTHGVRQSGTGTQSRFRNEGTGNDGRNIPIVPSGYNWTPANNMPGDETLYIRIPLAEMVHNEPTREEHRAQPVRSRYKLIDGSPSRTDFRRRKSYAMSFDNRTNNAEWVYEILNEETLANKCQQVKYDHAYDRGHLAAVANHRWCQEDRNDADLSSNIAPQHKSLNRGPWKTLENRCRDFTKEHGIRNVHVYTGPLYRRQMNPPELLEKRVPSDFFKVIIVENVNGTVVTECYLMPNDQITDTDIQYANLPHRVLDYIEYIESVSGLKFIERRPNVREERIITVNLQGEGVNKTPCNANIRVRICQNN